MHGQVTMRRTGTRHSKMKMGRRTTGNGPKWGAFFGIIVAFATLGTTISAQELTLEPHQELAREILRELIEINTVDSAGTTAAAEAMARRLLDAGFPAEDVNVVGPNERKMSLVALRR